MKKEVVVQLKFFCPRPQAPSWRTLPVEVRTKTIVLLARILRDRHEARPDDGDGKEACDE